MRKLDPVKHEEKRQEILDAAGRCFARDGFRGASISQICAEARMSSGHLYHYFASKEAIVAALAAAGMEQATARFARIMESNDVVAALVQEMDQVKAHHGGAKKALLLDMLAEAGRNPALAAILQQNSRGSRTLLAELIRKGQAQNRVDPGLDPELAATILIGVIDGSKTMALRDPTLDTKKSTELLKTLITRFLRPGCVVPK